MNDFLLHNQNQTTSRGFKEDDMALIGHLIGLCAKDFENSADYIRAEVTKLCEKCPLYN